MNESVIRVRDCLTELVAAALISDDRLSLDHRRAARAALAGLAADPPAAGSVNMDGAWTLAVKAAESPKRIPEEGRVSLTFPSTSPFALSELTAPGFDVDAAVERICGLAATG